MDVYIPGVLLENGSVLVVNHREGTQHILTLDEFKIGFSAGMLKYKENTSIVLLVLYVVVFLLAAVSNSLVIVVIYRFQHLRRFAANATLTISAKFLLCLGYPFRIETAKLLTGRNIDNL